MVNVIMTKRAKAGHRQRLRERFLAGEESTCTEEALLELLLTYVIPQKYVQPLARRLIVEFGSLSAVLAAPSEVLCQMKGIKSNTAALLKLVHWIRVHHPFEKGGKTGPEKFSPVKVNQLELPGYQSSFLDFQEQYEHRGIIPRTTVEETKTVFPRQRVKMFGKAVLKEAIEILPNIPDTDSLAEIRSFLLANLHFNAQTTRHRYANYILRRMFPNGSADKPLRSFARAFAGTQVLRDVCFYRFLRAEPLQVEVIQDLIIPNMGNGRLGRYRIRRYLSDRFPGSRSIVDCGKAIVEALTAAGIVRTDRTSISFAYRDISIPSFAFVLHSEFPDPGMYDIQMIKNNSVIQAMLWNPERILPLLYELRNEGIISKVSEIDDVRQFTTKWPLERVVEYLVDGGHR